MHILGPHPRPTELEAEDEAQKSFSTSTPWDYGAK